MKILKNLTKELNGEDEQFFIDLYVSMSHVFTHHGSELDKSSAAPIFDFYTKLRNALNKWEKEDFLKKYPDSKGYWERLC